MGKGDRVAWLRKNAKTYFELFYAIGRIGEVMVPIGWRLTPPEVRYILEDTGARVLFAGDGCDEAWRRPVKAGEPGPDRVRAETRGRVAAAEPAEFVPAGPDDAVLQLYTSGITGNPKMCPIGKARAAGNRT